MALVKMFLFLLFLLRVAIATPSLGELLLQDIQGTGGSCKKAIEFTKASLQIPDDMTLSVAKMKHSQWGARSPNLGSASDVETASPSSVHIQA
jgi:hypothetical protein